MAMQMEMIERSYDVIAAHGDEIVDRMYARAFAQHPEVRDFFAGIDMGEQRTKFLAMLSFMRKSTRDPDGLVPILQLLGAQHRRYGVLVEHYQILGAALLEAMGEVCGDAWLPVYAEAWAMLYGAVQRAMVSDTPAFLW
jgi:hemoglobin-like flavoprotein